MASKIVDDEIELHLLEKINHVIQRKGDKQNLVSKYYSLDPEFIAVKNILEPTTNPLHQEKWSSLRRENLYYLNNLLNEWQLIKKRSSFAPLEGREASANIKKSLKKMMKELKGEESSSRGDPEHSISHHQDPKHPIFERNKEDVYRWSSRHGPRKVHGFEHNTLAMERELFMRNINAPYKVFGIVGVAGIGKTTLCQDIFGRKLVREHFCPRIWVCLSKQPRDNDDYRKEIVIRILRCLGIDDEVINNTAEKGDEHGLRKLILLLRLQLIGKRYLIVLDDAWSDDEFFLKLTQTEEPNMKWGEELAYALPKGCGGAIISSGRSDVLLKKMLGKDVSLLYLKPHTDEIINEIFRDTVIGYDEDERDFPKDLEDLKMEILKRCDGIPLAAKLFAKIAREPLPLKFPPPPQADFDGGNEINQILANGGEQLKGGVDIGASGSGGHEDIQVPASGGEQFKGGVDAGSGSGGNGSGGQENIQVPANGGEQMKGIDTGGKGGHEDKHVQASAGEQLKRGVDAGGSGNGSHEVKQVLASGGEQLKDSVDAGGSGNGSHEDTQVQASGGEQLKDSVDAGGSGNGSHEDKQVLASGGEQLKDNVDAGGSGSGSHKDTQIQASGGEQLKDNVDASGSGNGSHKDKQVMSSVGEQLKDGVDDGANADVNGSGSHEDKQVQVSGGDRLKDSVNEGGSGSHENKQHLASGGEQLKDGVDASGNGSGSHEDKQILASGGEQLKDRVDVSGSGSSNNEDKQVSASGEKQLKGDVDAGGSGSHGQ